MEVAAIQPIAPQYQCPICRKFYPDQAIAVACRDQIDPEFYAPGSIVSISQGYSWFDGDPDWVVGDDKRPGPISDRRLSFLFVVTASHSDPHDPHRRVYSVRSLATVANTLRGWNPHQGHYRMNAIDPDMVPGSVRQKSAEFIGEKYSNLL